MTAKRKHHFDNELCMFCGLTGHIAKDCPKSTSRASKGRTAVTTLDDQPEVSSETKN
jgi:aspartyl aminopeptidase